MFAVSAVESSGPTEPLIGATRSSTDMTPFEPTIKAAGRHHLRTVYLVCFLSALLDFYTFVAMAPQTDILERIICRNHYGRPETGLESLDCKLEPIQTELAFVQEWRSSLGQMPGILLALPYGVMVDHHGRKVVFLLFMLGLFLSDTWVKIVYLFPDIFPVRAVLVGPIFQFIGGGGQVGDFIICAVIADVVPDEERVGALLKLTAMDLVAQILATLTAVVMMTYSSWLPLGLSSVLIVFISLLALKLSETRHDLYQAVAPDEMEESNLERCSLPPRPSLCKEYKKFFGSLKAILTGPVALLLLVFCLACFGAQALQLLLQYASKKFGWDYGKASFLMTLRSSFHLALAVVLMPLFDRWLSHSWRLSAAQKDMKLSQCSGALLFLGHLTLFIAEGPVMLCLGIVAASMGSSFLVTLRSTMTAMVPASSVSALYTAISIAHGAGTMLSGPLIALIYHWGMILGNGWLGLPFLVTATVHLGILAVLVLSFRMGT